mgnify:CR=1 FL=1
MFLRIDTLAIIIVEAMIVLFAFDINIKPLAKTGLLGSKSMVIALALPLTLLLYTTMLAFFVERTQEIS